MQIDNNKALADSLELLKQSDWHRVYNVEDIYRYIIAPIKHNKLRIYYQDTKPIALFTWCWLSKEDGQKFLENSHYITEEDYLSDLEEELWGIDFIAPFGNTKEIVRLLRKEHTSTYRRDEKIHWRRLQEPNRRHTRELKNEL